MYRYSAMAIPRVFILHYRVNCPDYLDYTNVPPIEVDEDAFHVTLKDKHAVVRMKEPCASKEDARSLVDPFLEKWEFEADLARPEAEAFRFQFIHAEIEGPAPAPHEHEIRMRAVATGTLRAQIRVAPPSYPRPPSSPLELSKEVILMHVRYQKYKHGRTLLPEMAYYCLTVLEDAAKGAKYKGKKREKAARQFKIELAVLDCIGHLCAEKGGDIARKAQGAPSKFTPEEKRFLELVIPVIIRRVAQIEAGWDAPTLSLANYVERSLPP